MVRVENLYFHIQILTCFLSRPLLRLPYLELPINSAALTLSAGTARRFSSHWHVSSLFGKVL